MPTKKSPTSTKPGVASVGDVPVTRAMLHGVRDELRARLDQTNARIDETNARIDETNARLDQTNARLDQTNARLDGLRAEVSARFDEVNARFDEVNARFDEVNARFDEVNARFDGLRAEVMAHVHRIEALVEEQEVRNRVVLEVVRGHDARFERIEASIENLREMVGEILVAVRRPPGG